MNELTRLTEDQRDALQELMNVAMGQAAAKLARLIDNMVVLSVPAISVASEHEGNLEDMETFKKTCSAITRQSFLGGLRGETLVSFGKEGADELAELIGYEEDMDQSSAEIMMEVTNILTGACIRGLAKELELDSSYAQPTLLAENSTLADTVGDKLVREQTLLLDVQFKVESHSFHCDLLICVANESIENVLKAINRLLEEF